MASDRAISEQFDQDVVYGAKPTATKIIHIGATSRFFRAHWADYVSDALKEDSRWGICAIALGHSEDSVQKLEHLAAFDNEYGLMAQGAGKPQYKVIRSVTKNISAPGNYEAVMDEFGNPDIEILSLTITDPGYCRIKESATPALNTNDAMIRHDLEQLRLTQDTPEIAPEIKSAIGMVVAGLRERMRQGLSGVTVLPLDNLEGNGDIISALVLEMAQNVDLELAKWIKDNNTFANTAVDRITPKASAEFAVAAAAKFAEEFPVIGSEAAKELAIDSNAWAQSPPPLEKVGVILTPEPQAFFTRKFRILNRGHTVVATLGQRIGTDLKGEPLDTIDKAISVPQVKTFFENILTKEVQSTLPEAAQNGIDDYKAEVIARFGNELLGDQVTRVGGEGQRKIPKYVFSGIESAQQQDLPYEGLTLVAATWVLSAATGVDQNGQEIDLNDPNLDKVQDAAIAMYEAATSHPDDSAKSLENVQAVIREHEFWRPFYDNGVFANAMNYYIREIDNKDLREVLSDYNQRTLENKPPVPVLEA